MAAFMAAGVLPAQDFAQYWTAAHLVRQNPYSFHQVSDFQHAHGILADPPLVLKNPPWAIPFILPLGWFSYRAAFAVWTLLSILIFAACNRAIWGELNRGPSLIPLLLPLLFGPTIVQLMLGQWTVLVFLGVVVFLIAAERHSDWVAGASLVLLLGKPHVTLLFLLAILLWALQQKRWRIFVACSLALVSASLAVELLNPHIWAQFVERTSRVVHESEAYPNVGGILYKISGVHLLGLLPQVAGLIWLVFYWRRHRRNWQWMEHGTMVLLCSVVCSYYSYPYDEILAIPALLVASQSANRRAFLIAFLVTNAGYALYIMQIAGYFGFGYMFLWWTALGWLATSVLAQTRLFKDAEA